MIPFYFLFCILGLTTFGLILHSVFLCSVPSMFSLTAFHSTFSPILCKALLLLSIYLNLVCLNSAFLRFSLPTFGRSLFTLSKLVFSTFSIFTISHSLFGLSAFSHGFNIHGCSNLVFCKHCTCSGKWPPEVKLNECDKILRNRALTIIPIFTCPALCVVHLTVI